MDPRLIIALGILFTLVALFILGAARLARQSDDASDEFERSLGLGEMPGNQIINEGD
jgi:hypothetical protein